MARSLRTLDDLKDAELIGILERARELKPAIRSRATIGTLGGRVVGLLFEKPSTRTRLSFETAALRLGGQTVHMASTDLQLGRGEPVSDTARVLGRYLDVVVARVFAQRTIEELASHSGIPVINGLSDAAHPTQAVCDLMTVLEASEGETLRGVKLAYVGDGNNVARSLMLGAAKVGMDIAVACPPGYEPRGPEVDAARRAADRTGARVSVTEDPLEAVAGADFVYADVWVSMGQDAEKDSRERAFAGYQVDATLMAVASPVAKVMHCLPAHRGFEIAEDVIDGPRSIVFEQAENKLHAAAAILEFLCA